MCIAIVKKPEGIITDDELRNCFKNNPNGAGIAYIKDNQLYVIKGIFNENEFVTTVRKAESETDKPMLIHCRISTSGLIDVDNSHPHVVNDSTVLIHNGILDIDVPKNSNKSDTVLYIENNLKDLPIDFIYNDFIMRLIEKDIGKTNKFCFLNTNGDYKILNEREGYWKQGVWFSNTTYKESYVSYGYYNKYYDEWEDEDLDYLDKYNMTRDQFLDMVLTNDRYIRYDILSMIEELTNEELVMLGSTPVINIETLDMRADNGKLDLHEFYLFEVDDKLQEDYEVRYYNYDIEEDVDQYV